MYPPVKKFYSFPSFKRNYWKPISVKFLRTTIQWRFKHLGCIPQRYVYALYRLLEVAAQREFPSVSTCYFSHQRMTRIVMHHLSRVVRCSKGYNEHPQMFLHLTNVCILKSRRSTGCLVELTWARTESRSDQPTQIEVYWSPDAVDVARFDAHLFVTFGLPQTSLTTIATTAPFLTTPEPAILGPANLTHTHPEQAHSLIQNGGQAEAVSEQMSLFGNERLKRR